MKKRVPLMLTASRIVMTLAIYPLIINDWIDAALVLYLLAGITDVLDGWLARRWKATSRKGAMLDSLADYVLYLSIPVWVYLRMPDVLTTFAMPLMMVLVVTVLSFAVKIAKGAAFRHLTSAKIAGALTFIAGFSLLSGFPFTWPVWLAACAIVVTELEEIAIMSGVNKGAP